MPTIEAIAGRRSGAILGRASLGTPPQLVNDGAEAYERFRAHFGLRPRRADLATLGELQAAFATLPYENLTKILARVARDGTGAEPLLRSPATVLREHVAWGAGGTCFSLTHALAAILARAGFSRAWPVTADLGPRPEAHCALVVGVGDRRYLIDPGYLLGKPLPLAAGAASVEHNGLARLELIPAPGGGHVLWTADRQGRKARYRLRPDPVDPARFVALWRASFEAPGMGRLLVTACRGGQRLYLHHRHLRRWTAEGVERLSVGADQVEAVAGWFGIDRDLVRRAAAQLAAVRSAPPPRRAPTDRPR